MPIANHPITRTTSVQDLNLHAQSEMQRLFTGEEFIVRDLFPRYEWRRIDRENRTHLGSLFFSFAKGEGAAQVLPLDKTPKPKNQQRYRKI